MHLNFTCTLNYVGCGGTFGNYTGIITSPSYPSNYGNNEICAYLLIAPEPGLLTLRTFDFSLESKYDFVKVSKEYYFTENDTLVMLNQVAPYRRRYACSFANL